MRGLKGKLQSIDVFAVTFFAKPVSQIIAFNAKAGRQVVQGETAYEKKQLNFYVKESKVFLVLCAKIVYSSGILSLFSQVKEGG